MSDPLTKGLVRDAVERSSKGMSYNLGLVNMVVTLPTRLEIPKAIFKYKNKVMTNGSTLSINSIHSHDEDNVQEYD